MTLEDALQMDAEILLARKEEVLRVADMVEHAWQECDPHREEWVLTGLDRELLLGLADRIRETAPKVQRGRSS